MKTQSHEICMFLSSKACILLIGFNRSKTEQLPVHIKCSIPNTLPSQIFSLQNFLVFSWLVAIKINCFNKLSQLISEQLFKIFSVCLFFSQTAALCSQNNCSLISCLLFDNGSINPLSIN